MMVEIQWWDFKGDRETRVTCTELRYGAFVPQGWKLEYTGWGAADAWARTVELAQLAEQLGYDHLWVYDHVETVPRREPTHVFEAFTMLAALVAAHRARSSSASSSPARRTATPGCSPRKRRASTCSRAAG